MTPQRFQIVDPTGLSRAQRLAATGLVVRTLPHYYESVLCASGSGMEILADLFGFPGGTAGNTVVALDRDGTVAGTVAGNGSGAVQRAQMAYMQTLFRRLDDQQRAALREILADTARRTESISTPGWYLAGISVAPDCHGSGLADCLMEVFYAQAPDAQEYSLHVHRDNVRAISFYRRHGFVFSNEAALADDSFIYRAMRRDGRARPEL